MSLSDLVRDETSAVGRNTTFEFKIVDGTEIFNGAYVGIDPATGRVTNMVQTDGCIPIGHVTGFSGNAQGTDDAGTGNSGGTVLAHVSINQRIFSALALTGEAAAGVGDLVYMTDEDTYTLTRAAGALPVGFYFRYAAGSNQVLIFSTEVAIAIQAANLGERVRMYLGEIDLANKTTGDLIAGIPFPSVFGELVAVEGIVTLAVAGGTGDDGTIFLEQNTTNITGGVITVTAGDAVNTRSAGSAVTSNAAAQIHEGEVIDIEWATTGSFTAGKIQIFATYKALLGS